MKSPHELGSTEIGGEEPCGCGSEKTYSDCCKVRGFRWVRDKEGVFYKEVPIDTKTITAFEETKKRFEIIFNREAQAHDRIFIGASHLSVRDIRKRTVEWMKSASFEPEVIFAYQRTDRIVEDVSLLTPSQEAAHVAAIEEFRERVEQGESPNEILDPESPEKILIEALVQVQIICAYYVEVEINDNLHRMPDGAEGDCEFLIAFAFVNFVKSLRSILVMVENGCSYDSIYLVRSLYENYLVISYLYRWPERVSQFKQIDDISAYGIEKKNREQNARAKHPPKWINMAKDLGEEQLYRTLYSELSLVTHSRGELAKYFVENGVFEYFDLEFEISALSTAVELCLRIVSRVLKYGVHSELSGQDLKTALKKAFLAWKFVKTYIEKTDGVISAELSEEFARELIVDFPDLATIGAAVSENASQWPQD